MERILLCSEDIPSGAVRLFNELGYGVMRIPGYTVLQPPVASHPDMLFSVFGDGSLLTDRNYFINNPDFFKALAEKSVRMVLSRDELKGEYPRDVLFDAIRTEKLLIGNLKYTARELFSDDITAVNVRQGYALCSTLLMKGSAISADGGICKALSENGYEVLRISAGGIVLDGYGYGFIGGASAVLNECKTVVFFGNVSAHADGERIISFCKERGYNVLFDESYPLTDLGGVKVLYI